MICGSLWDKDWGKLATANNPGLGNEPEVIIKGPILGSSKPLIKQPIDNCRTLGLGFCLITEAFLTPRLIRDSLVKTKKEMRLKIICSQTSHIQKCLI